MRRHRGLLRVLGSIGLTASVVLGLSAAWPVGRQSVPLDLAPIELGGLSADVPTSSPVRLPGFSLHLDLPAGLVRGRAERVSLRLEAPPVAETLIVTAGILSSELRIDPPGESGQAFRPEVAFAWKVVAGQGGEATATIVLRLRHASDTGALGGERLLLARDVRLPVRTALGLAAPAAGWTAGALALASGLALLAAGAPGEERA